MADQNILDKSMRSVFGTFCFAFQIDPEMSVVSAPNVLSDRLIVVILFQWETFRTRLPRKNSKTYSTKWGPSYRSSQYYLIPQLLYLHWDRVRRCLFSPHNLFFFSMPLSPIQTSLRQRNGQTQRLRILRVQRPRNGTQRHAQSQRTRNWRSYLTC